MSQKWRRNKAWEDQNLTGLLTPIRIILRTFETIPLAIVLLTFVSLYATAASIPIGMLAQIPTYLIYVLTLIVPVAVLGVVSIRLIGAKCASMTRPKRFLVSFFVTVSVSAAFVVFWSYQIIPTIRYNPATGDGFRLFGTFSDTYPSTTLRRLPGFEMTEMQFYGWWPLRVVLFLFVINLIVTTIRRIEFTFKNLGVLSVHTGIITIALGSLYYTRFKLEGDILLPAPQSITQPVAGQPPRVLPQRSFFSREEVVLYLAQETGFSGQPLYEQRPLDKLPRYNDYNLTLNVPTGTKSLNEILDPTHTHDIEDVRTLNFDVPFRQGSIIDPNIKLNIVGYANYAQLEEEWFNTDPLPGEQVNPVTVVDMFAQVPGAQIPTGAPAFRFPLFPGIPAKRIAENQIIGLEYTINMPESRWQILSEPVPVASDMTPSLHAIVVEIPGIGFKKTYSIREGQRIELDDTGYTIAVNQIAPTPPFPIITPGYEDANSSVAILGITTPTSPAPVDRWAFHRFPELDQDLTPTPSGRPDRSPPNPEILISYLDLTRLQVYIDDRPDGTTRALIRQPVTAALRTIELVGEDGLPDIVPNDEGAVIDLRFGLSWPHAKRISHPIPVPLIDQDKSLIGSHTNALTAVQVTYEGTDWSEIVWVPFAKYIGVDQQPVEVRLPTGDPLLIGVGRTQRPLPGFAIALVDFEMIAYDHRGAPRDYQSLVRVEPSPSNMYPQPPNFDTFEHIVKLNAPLRAPYHWDPEKTWLANSARRLQAGMNPEQFKFSQSGWDRAGWNQSQDLVDQGLLDKPRVNFTILGVGNNPGIHIIAFGAILFSLGVPWAFYFKPYLVRRERDRIKSQLANASANTESSTSVSPAKATAS
ncbi:MAG: hypothetical protein AB8C13_06350 [Phycisphaerales bacterium]